MKANKQSLLSLCKKVSKEYKEFFKYYNLPLF